MSVQMPVEVFPAGGHLADELEARGWTQVDFAEVLGRPTQFVSEVLSGKKEITRESAAQIAAALGTSAEFWLNLQDSYLLWTQSQDDQAQADLSRVETRARLRDLVPVPLLVQRGIVTSSDLEGRVREVLDLLGMESLEDEPAIEFAARRSDGDESGTMLQRAWVACVRMAASGLEVAEYSEEAFDGLARTLSSSAREVDALGEFQRLFAEVGVKLVYVEAFPGGKVDGCSMVVDGTPVIGVSGRGKRLDDVLFTVLHESAHVLLGHLDNDGEAIVDDLSEAGSGMESDADSLARRLAISVPVPDVPSRVSMRWVQERAAELRVHPMTLIGRLQKEGKLSWNSSLVRAAPKATDQLEKWTAS